MDLKMSKSLSLFVLESNKIEGIIRSPTEAEIEAHEHLLEINDLMIEDICKFVAVVQPNAVIRDRQNLNVRVGNHIAPRGGSEIPFKLNELLGQTLDGDPYRVHQAYETLHPFTDGNGRSGRAIWLYMMDRRGEFDRTIARGFLHTWYYQSLSAGRL